MPCSLVFRVVLLLFLVLSDGELQRLLRFCRADVVQWKDRHCELMYTCCRVPS
jgi:hypothetical protein